MPDPPGSAFAALRRDEGTPRLYGRRDARRYAPVCFPSRQNVKEPSVAAKSFGVTNRLGRALVPAAGETSG